MWTWRALALGGVTASALVAAGPAAAQLQKLYDFVTGGDADVPKAWQACQGQKGSSIDARINGCSTAIAEAGSVDKRNLAAAYANRGRAYQERGDVEHALQDFEAAIRNDPKLASAYLGRGSANTQKHAYDLAIQDYNQSIKLEPTDSNAFFIAGPPTRCRASMTTPSLTSIRRFASNRSFPRL
jgi:tetratricopeptide (TPR) repeat protein